jgi:hypothetical protein
VAARDCSGYRRRTDLPEKLRSVCDWADTIFVKPFLLSIKEPQMIKSSFVIASLAAVSLAANTARAEGDDAAAEPSTDPAPPADPATPAVDTAMSASATAPFFGSLLVAKAKILIGVGVSIGFKKPQPIAFASDGTAAIPGSSNGIWARYGVTDKIDAGAGYSYSLKSFEIKGDLAVTAGYLALTGSAGGKLDLAARVNVGYNVLASKLDPIGLGADVRYKISDKMAVFSSNQLQIGIASKEVVTGPVTVKITDGKYLQLPVGFAFGVNDKLTVHASTNLAVIKIADSATGFIFADFIPLTVGGMYMVSPKISAGASVVFADLKADAGNLGAAVALRYSL